MCKSNCILYTGIVNMVQISSIGNNLGHQRQQQRPHRHHCTSSGIASCVRRAATRKTRAFLRFYIYSSPYYTKVTLHPVRIVIAACPSNHWFAYFLLGCRYPLLLHLLLLPQLCPIFDLTPPHNNTTTIRSISTVHSDSRLFSPRNPFICSNLNGHIQWMDHQHHHHHQYFEWSSISGP